MRVLQVVKGLRKASGVATFVRELSDTLWGNGESVSIGMCRPECENWMPPKGGESVVSLGDATKDEWDVVHVHGLWDWEIRLAAGWAMSTGTPLVWSPHGMLAPWALRYRWWKKCLPWHLYLKRLLQQASVFHVTAPLEADWIRELGFKNRIEVVPLGTHLPDLSGQRKKLHGKYGTLLFVGRIHPVKGLENLIRSIACLKSRKPASIDFRVRIIGTDDQGYEVVLCRLAQELGVEKMVEFPGPKFDADLVDEYLSCDGLILPSFTENFGGVVVDALAAGKPVIASTKTPWEVLAGTNGKGRMGWFVDNSPESLATAIGEWAMMPQEERDEMGRRGRSFVETNYTWTAVANQMKKVYNSLR